MKLNFPNLNLTFILRSVFRYPSDSEDVNICSEFFNSSVPLVCARNPVSFRVCTKFCGGSTLFVPFPACIFQEKSFVELELVANFFCKLPSSGVVSLVHLKKLVLKGTLLDTLLMETLVKSCPLLETLSLSCFVSKFEMFDHING